MRIDLPATDHWEALCQQYRSALRFDEPALLVHVYAGYQHALWELTQSLAKLFPHKRTVAIVDREEPSFEALAVAFSSEGYTVKALTPKDEEDVGAWLPQIQADLLFVLASEDDPVTGKLADHQKLWDGVKDKRVFRISVSHANYRFHQVERPGLFDLRVLSLSPSRALVVGGERCRAVPPLTRLLPWPVEAQELVSQQVTPISALEATRLEKSVRDFESRLPEGFVAYFKPETKRLFDRAVICHSEIDGCSLITELVREAGLPLSKPGTESPFEATSPCRWENPRFAEWLSHRGETDERVRGLVIFAAETLSPELGVSLERAAVSILKVQRGE